MGRLEKIVVLTVLFLVAVVLGVALTPTGDSSSRGSGKRPIALGDEQQAADKGVPGVLTRETVLPKPGEAPPSQPDAKSPPPVNAPPAANPPLDKPVATPTPVPAPAAKYTVTLEGLEPSNLPDMMFYSWQQGDTFAGVAQRYYGSKDKVTRLTKVNEGRSEASLVAGDRLWIPISESTKADAVSDGRTYLVKKGDVLSSISQHFYGTAKKWPKILDANRDVLASPEKLKPGMTLRIPE